MRSCVSLLLLLRHMQALLQTGLCMPGLTLWCHWWFQVLLFIVSWRSSNQDASPS